MTIKSLQPLRLVLLGASGRMGTTILDLIRESDQIVLSGAIVSSQSKLLGGEALAGVLFSDSLEKVLPNAHVVIDFSVRENSLYSASLCALHQIPLLIAVTGHNEDEMKQLRKTSHTIPIGYCPNTSLGVAVLHQLAQKADSLLTSDYDRHLSEIHHRRKKDIPSGTAKSLQSCFKKREPEISSIRGGEVIGDHSVHFFGEFDEIVLTHRAYSRKSFARGALMLAQRLAAARVGWHTAQSLYGISHEGEILGPFEE